jgi:hypothetical protein
MCAVRPGPQVRILVGLGSISLWGRAYVCVLSFSSVIVHQAEAVVLRTWPIHEADLIVALFTRSYGKVKGIAKSASKSRRRFGGALEPMTSSTLLPESQALADRIFRQPVSAFAEEEWPRNRAADLRRFAIQGLERHLERKLTLLLIYAHLPKTHDDAGKLRMHFEHIGSVAAISRNLATHRWRRAIAT